jgi:hypothetical protein
MSDQVITVRCAIFSLSCWLHGDDPFILCLTGSLGMGKSRTATFFAEAGVPVHDSDAVAHALYEGEAVPLIEQAFPGATAGGKVRFDGDYFTILGLSAICPADGAASLKLSMTTSSHDVVFANYHSVSLLHRLICRTLKPTLLRAPHCILTLVRLDLAQCRSIMPGRLFP